MSERTTSFIDRVDQVASQADVSQDWLRENVLPLLTVAAQGKFRDHEAQEAMAKGGEPQTLSYGALKNYFACWEQAGTGEDTLNTNNQSGGGYQGGNYQGGPRNNSGGQGYGGQNGGTPAGGGPYRG